MKDVNVGLSKGNFLVATNGNALLDLHVNFAHLPLGYNHSVLANVSAIFNLVLDKDLQLVFSMKQRVTLSVVCD